ncbi:MAG: hypothetical protein GXY64_01565 [Bacteroidales bacterium]|nr:hypothetical protein [Bacteroidales bacterium]
MKRMKRQGNPSISHPARTKRSSCPNEQWFNGKLTIVQVPMNNGAMNHEQWCVFDLTSI